MSNEWTKDFELQYWIAHPMEFYTNNVLRKLEILKFSEFVKEPINCVIDIGGGAYGGALRNLEIVKSKILVDALANEYRAMKTLPFDIDSITADFSEIPLEIGCADILFALNVHDHAKDNEHFIKGIYEALRLIKDNGLFFASFPLRKLPTKGHPICLTESFVYETLRGLFDILYRIIQKDGGNDVLYLVGKAR